VCNITDEADRSLPVFGPVPVALPRALTDYVRQVRVSRLRDMPADASQVPCPANEPSLRFRKRRYAMNHCNVNPELWSHPADERFVYYACEFTCPEPMRLLLYLGYDGPVKVWVDRKELFSDPEGTNPAMPTDARIPLPAGRGTHKLRVALGANGGRATGIFLRFERTDVSAARRRKGPSAWVLPEVRA
jgi:hypothetical protein